MQLCGSNIEQMSRVSEVLSDLQDDDFKIDFIDLNVGCPIDLVVQKGNGSGLMNREKRFVEVVRAMSAASTVPITVKCRTGYVDYWLVCATATHISCCHGFIRFYTATNTAHTLIPSLERAGIAALSIHGRSRQQRYSLNADWAYLKRCAQIAKGCDSLPFFGNGDICSYKHFYEHLEKNDAGETPFAGAMIGRAALIKPWIFTEIKERRDWDISASERLDMIRQYVNFAIEHWVCERTHTHYNNACLCVLIDYGLHFYYCDVL